MLLFIGSTVADVMLRVPGLPRPGDDLNLHQQTVSLGGCAFNAYSAARLLGQQCVLFSPIGTGIWGNWVRQALAERKIYSAVPPVEEPNGCCYCLTEPNGNRTFLCEHGAEYHFRRAWFNAIGEADVSAIYLCGLEIEEATGEVILSYLEENPPRKLYFAPGPRLCRIKPQLMARVLALHPVLHLSQREAKAFTRQSDPATAAAMLHHLTKNEVILTAGKEGAWLYTEEGGRLIPTETVPVCNTIGAGDANIGAIMACEAADCAPDEAVYMANRVSAAIVSHKDATITQAEWNAWQLQHPSSHQDERVPPVILETPRLFLRRLRSEDYPALCRTLQDNEAMAAYEGAFSDEEVHQWLQRQLERYARWGFGLWAVVCKETGELIGQCGLTMQPWNGRDVLEIGYLFERAHWRHGYATEAAQACKAYAFTVLQAPAVCSIIRDTNAASQRVALRNGMHPYDHAVKHYRGVDMPHTRYVVVKE